ncbi:MAG: hypothetical protein ACOC85_02720 [Thermoplasmatota archaeon]
MNGLVTIFLIAGIFSLTFYKDESIIKTRNVLKFLVGISFFLTVLTIVIGYTLFRPFLLSFFLRYMSGLGPFIPLMMFFILFLSYLAGFILLLLQSFGLVSVIVLFNKKYFPKILNDIKKISNRLEKRESFFDSIYLYFLRWTFDIPRVLDTSEVKIGKKVSQDSFSWKNFSNAFFLESILAVVLAIYISLNPLLLAERSLNELFALATTLSYFIPILVIPLFIYLKLYVKIPGPNADFLLFEGIRSRMLGLILTLGTIILFLRLAIDTVDLKVLANSFLFYFAGFLMNTFFITFVYFNYFDNLLAEDILYDLDEKG